MCKMIFFFFFFLYVLPVSVETRDEISRETRDQNDCMYMKLFLFEIMFVCICEYYIHMFLSGKFL